jgi:hypothetical protein
MPAAALPPKAAATTADRRVSSGKIGKIAVGRILWSRDLIPEIPRIEICFGGVLEGPSSRNQQMAVIIKIVDRANVEPGSVFAPDCSGGLMEKFTADSQLLGYLLLLTSQPVAPGKRTTAARVRFES